MTQSFENIEHPSNWNRDERNLYNRVFGGVLFAAGDHAEERASVLFGCHNRLPHELGRSPVPDRTPRPDGTLTITFDNNLHDIIHAETSGPEFGDVVIWGESNFLTIEAKCNTDWTFDKDVKTCWESGAKVAASTGLAHLAHVLVVAEKKWDSVRRPAAVRQRNSQHKRLIEWLPESQANVCVLTWEQIADRALDQLGHDAGRFPAWLKMQVGVCRLGSDQMPPR